MTYLLFYIGGYVFTVWTTCRLIPTKTNEDILKCAIFWPLSIPLCLIERFKDNYAYNKDSWLNTLIDKWKQ